MRKRWVWALVLALILQSLAFAACAEEETVEPEMADSFVLRDGFTWQTTQEELLALMDGYEYDVGFEDNYIFDAVPVAGYQGLMTVLYGGEVPLAFYYNIANGDLEKLAAALETKYAPAEAHEAELIALMQMLDRVLSGEEADYSDVFFDYLKHWVGPENTQIYLYQFEGDTIVAYINASALENADISAPVNADGL